MRRYSTLLVELDLIRCKLKNYNDMPLSTQQMAKIFKPGNSTIGKVGQRENSGLLLDYY